MEFQTILDIAFLMGVVAFIVGLRRLSSPDTARAGNLIAAFGMAIGIVVAMIYPAPAGEAWANNYFWIIGGMIVGSGVGAVASKRVQLTNMPQLVSLFNGFGGACAVLIAVVELTDNITFGTESVDPSQVGIILFTLFVGAVAFTGSMLAYAKLDGLIWDNTIKIPAPNITNNILLAAIIGLMLYLILANPANGFMLSMVLMVISLIYGITFVVPIGGADMPVVISLLNSFTGLTAAAAGLIYGNQIMLTGGILVGASGTILTVLMCEAMNRSLFNVIFGSFGATASSTAKSQDGQVAKEVSLQDAAIQLYYSQSVVVVPGYGLAVAQAQKVCKELDDLLEANGVNVKYAIHPVAGRMPGHMNVLLAEADVPYPKLLDLDDANDKMPNTDVVVVVGANDVVNPSAEDDPSSPIYGMPIIKVLEAKNVIVLKRSMRPGYSGIQNPLFFHAKTRMLFGDAKKSIASLVSEVKDLA